MVLNIYDSLNFLSTAEILSGARISITPSADIASLYVRGYSPSQTSDILTIQTSVGSNIFRITGNPLIEVYSDLRYNSGSNVINTNYSTRIISGLYIAPVLNFPVVVSGTLAGTLNANSNRIQNLSPGSALLDAATVNQVNAAVSGHTSNSDPHTGYLLLMPNDVTRSTICPDRDIAVLTLCGSSSGDTSNILELYDELDGALCVSVANTGDAVFYGLFSVPNGVAAFSAGIEMGNSKILNLGDSTTMAGAANLGQVNSVASGLNSTKAIHQWFDSPALSGTTEQVLWAYSGVSIGANDGLNVKLKGYLLNNSGTNRNITLRLYWDNMSSAIFGDGVWLITSGVARLFESEFSVQNLGSTNKQLIQGRFDYAASNADRGSVSGLIQVGGWGATGSLMRMDIPTFGTVVTTSAKLLKITMQPDAADSRLYSKLDYAEVRYTRGTL